MKLPVQSPPVVRYSTSNLTISGQESTDSSGVAPQIRTQSGHFGYTDSFSLGGISPSATCVSVGISGGRACLNVPVVGNVCLPIPIPVPSGTAAKACISLCTKWGIPMGACVNVTVLGRTFSKCFGAC